jgi:hypothetical protein
VAQDRIAEQRESREADRPPEVQSPQADLTARLERLPVGHPSSPYRDDGSRKPPPLDLSKYELPLPNESDSPASQDVPAADQARIGPDGSWEWKGYELSREQSQMADRAIVECFDAEGRDVNGDYSTQGLTPAMRRIEAQLEHGHLVEDTEKFALKDPDRLKEKFAKLIRDRPGADPSTLVQRINDGVRYTFIYDDTHYSSGVMEVSDAVSTTGYELYERKNAWVDETKVYQGVNSTWREDSHGVLFEVQVHTPASWRAKQESHDAYEVGESLSSTEEQRTDTARRQKEIFAKVPIPPGVVDIPSYRKEGW